MKSSHYIASNEQKQQESILALKVTFSRQEIIGRVGGSGGLPPKKSQRKVPRLLLMTRNNCIGPKSYFFTPKWSSLSASSAFDSILFIRVCFIQTELQQSS